MSSFSAKKGKPESYSEQELALIIRGAEIRGDSITGEQLTALKEGTADERLAYWAQRWLHEGKREKRKETEKMARELNSYATKMEVMRIARQIADEEVKDRVGNLSIVVVALLETLKEKGLVTDEEMAAVVEKQRQKPAAPPELPPEALAELGKEEPATPPVETNPPEEHTS